jgi:hypothetical protein
MPPVQLVCGTLNLDRNRKNQKAGRQNLQKLRIMGFILCILCLWCVSWLILATSIMMPTDIRPITGDGWYRSARRNRKAKIETTT